METAIFEPIVIERIVPLGALLEEIKVEITIYPSFAKELFGDYYNRIFLCENVEALEAQQALPQGYLNQLRHENTNYDREWQRLKGKQGYSEDIHDTIRTKYNDLISQICQDNIFSRGTDVIQRRKNELQQKEHEEQTRRLEEEREEQARRLEMRDHRRLEPRSQQNEHQEQARRIQAEKREEQLRLEAEKLEAIRQDSEKLRNTKYCLTVAEVKQMLSTSPHKTFGENIKYRAPVPVLETYAYYGRSTKFYMCAVVSNSCDWLDFNASGLSKYKVNYEKEPYTLDNLTVAKANSQLARSLRQGKLPGDIVSIGEHKPIIVCIGGGRFSDIIDWDASTKRLEQERQQTKLLIEAQKAMRLVQQAQELQEAEILQQKQIAQKEEEARQRQQIVDMRATQYERPAGPIPYQSADTHLKAIKYHVKQGASSHIIHDWAKYLRSQCEVGLSRDPSAASPATNRGGAKAGAVVGGFLGLAGGPLVAIAFASLGGVLGDLIEAGANSSQSTARLNREQDEWMTLIKEIDEIISDLPEESRALT